MSRMLKLRGSGGSFAMAPHSHHDHPHPHSYHGPPLPPSHLSFDCAQKIYCDSVLFQHTHPTSPRRRSGPRLAHSQNKDLITPLGKMSACTLPILVRAFVHGAMGRRIDPSWGGPIELFLVPASAPRLV